MHKISNKDIQDLANHLMLISKTDDTLYLLEKARELYEKALLLHHTTAIDDDIEVPEINPIDIKEPTEEPTKIEPTKDETSDLSVNERIKQIMDNAPSFEVSSDKKTEYKEEMLPDEPLEEKVENTTDLPKVNLEDEFKDAISADYAVDLFEKAEKIEVTKKSLNEKLSQKHLQIGLNDRIAFVKHLFNGSQPDFNRVLSQLNSFQTEAQAKHFIESVVKPDYDWKDKAEYEERLIDLIERKFL